MLNRTNNLLLFCLLILFCPSILAASNEEQRLLNSKNFIFINLPNKYLETKIVRKDSFQVSSDVSISIGSTKSITLDYDKKWTIEDTRYLSEYEITTKYKGQLNLHEVYWKDGYIQAYIIKRFYPALGIHKITDIFDRQYLLTNM